MMRIKYKFLLIGLLLMFFASPALASGDIQKIGHLANGPSFDLVEANGYLYVGQGAEVRIYDISDENKIAQLSWKDHKSKIYTEYLVRALYIDFPYLYITTDGKFIIADISNPSSPSIISYLWLSARDVEVKGNYAYLAVNGAGVGIIDISNKPNPTLVKTFALSGYNRPWRLNVSGNYLYVAMETDNRLDIIDITDPTRPLITGSWSSNTGINSFSGVAVKGKYAYVTEYHEGLHVIDVSNPTNPVNVMDLMGMNANDIKIIGDHAYVSVRYQGFNIIDISNPEKISIAGKGEDIAGYNEGIFPTPNYTFLSAESMGFGVYNTADVTAPKLMVKIPVIGGVDSVAAKDNYMYIGAHNDGVWVVDISNPAIPVEVAFIDNRGRNTGMDIQGNYLYVAGSWSGLNVIDITNPTNPKLVVFDYGDNIDWGVLADGNYLYTSAGIVDISDPTKPSYIYYNPSYFYGKSAKYGKNYLLVAVKYAEPKGLHILDVSNKLNPTLVSNFWDGTYFEDVAVAGNTAFALTYNDMLAIDISDAANPTLLDKVSYPGEWLGYSVDIDKNIAYAAGGPIEGIKAFNITNPSSIQLIEEFDLGGGSDIRYYNGDLLVADGKVGAYILSSLTSNYTPTSFPLPAPAPTETPTPTPTATPTPTPPSPISPPISMPTPTPTSQVPTPTPTPTPEPPKAIYFDVKSGQDGWQTSGLWHITSDRYNSSNHSFWYGNETTENYDTGSANSGELISPEISLENINKPMLYFMSLCKTEFDLLSLYTEYEKNYDKTLVQISVNNGSWTNLKQITHNSRAWVKEKIDLSGYAGNKIRIRFFFDTGDNKYNKYEGWYVDDVEIKGG